MATEDEMDDTRNTAERDGSGSTTQALGFRRVLVVVDESGEARAAASYATDLSRQFGGTVATLMVTETKARQRSGEVSAIARSGSGVSACTVSGPTEGARSHTLAAEVARTAEGFGADVIVLGLSRARLARHRLAPSLRNLVAQATEVPVLLAPVSWGEEQGPETDHVPDRDPLGAEYGVLTRGSSVRV